MPHGFSARATLLALALLTLPAFADTITMTNGDKFTGTIEEVSPSTVIVTSPYAGRLLIDRKAVATLRSEKPVVIVSEKDDRTNHYVTPTPDNKSWTTADKLLPIVAVAATQPTTPPRATSWLQISPDWKNQAALGVLMNSGNDNTTQFNGDLTLHYDKKPDDFTFKIDAAYGNSNSKLTQGLAAQNAVYRHDINNKVYTYLDDDVRYDAIKGISLQAQATGGLGYWLARSDKFKLDVRGGPGLTYLKTFDGETDFSPAVEAGMRAEYVFNERVNATQEAMYTTSVTDLDQWRIHSETALNVKLDLERGLGLKFAFIDSYENQPSAGRQNNDTRLTLSLTLDF